MKIGLKMRKFRISSLTLIIAITATFFAASISAYAANTGDMANKIIDATKQKESDTKNQINTNNSDNGLKSDEIVNGTGTPTPVGPERINNGISNPTAPVQEHEDVVEEITGRPNSNNNTSTSTSTNTNTNNTVSQDSSERTSGNELFKGGECNYILGMTNWDCGVVITDDENTLKSGIWEIAANIAVDITILASYLALGYVIYGGYLYSFSGGEPSKTAAGKKTLTQAFIGLTITMSANAIMSTIRFVLLGNSGTLLNCATEGCIKPEDLVLNTIHWIIAMAGIVSTVFVVYGGISYTTSSGSPDKLKKAKTIITNAIIGLVIVALAEVITAFVSNIIRNANIGASQSNNSSLTIGNKTEDTSKAILRKMILLNDQLTFISQNNKKDTYD